MADEELLYPRHGAVRRQSHYSHLAATDPSTANKIDARGSSLNVLDLSLRT